jgi:uncharacterized FlaG/YvyC family protein
MENVVNSVSSGGAAIQNKGELSAAIAVERAAPAVAQTPSIKEQLQFPKEGARVAPSNDATMTAAVEQVSSFLRLSDTNLELRVDQEAGNKSVVSVYDGEDGTLVRQYPTDEMLEIARRITEQMNEFRDALVHGGVAPSMSGLFTNTVV